MKKIICCLLIVNCYLLIAPSAQGASVVATVNGNPITDVDITSRTKLMALQGQSSTDNRRRALSNIIDDHVKLAYAESMKITPPDSDVKNEIEQMRKHGMNTSGLSATDLAMLHAAVRANIAWQVIIGRTVMPTITVTDEDIVSETADLERDRGLPVEVTIIRLVGIPESVSNKLSKPESCAAAESMARGLGGEPQKMTVNQYELSEDIRERLIGLPLLTWSKRMDSSVLLICSKKKTAEYGKLDEIIKQNAIYKRASFVADQQLKQLRRKAVVVILDDMYK
ncbi:MAG: SurA N-terminal domain-containing protein [Alphaproteobacteria bacterium]|nr:SurA N-terminal domain-containing protein [Alphaproteobacteria bacterium]